MEDHARSSRFISSNRPGEKVPLSVRVDEGIIELIDAEARKVGVDRSRVTRTALIAYFDPTTKPHDPMLACLAEMQANRRCVLKTLALLMTELRFSAEQQARLLEPLSVGLVEPRGGADS